jgi:predicted GNAT family acetyltransferase
MADDALAPTENPFDQLDPEKVGTIAPPKEEAAPLAAGNDNQEKNPFDDLGEVGESPATAKGAFARGAERGVVPAATGLIGAGLGGAGVVAAGAAAGTTVGPFGTLIGGAAGALVGGYLGSAAQDWALKKLPDSWVDALGMDDRQQRLDETQHSTASFLGGLTPYAVTMRPSLSFAATKLPENATALQKIMANPTTARLFGGAAVGGMELGQEAAHGDVDWSKVAISTAFGVVFDRPTKLGESLTGLGERPFRPATVAQAGDVKVMGPGVTEDVFQGSHEQAPQAAMTAQEAARAEQAATGEQPEPDVHAVAKQMHPELFERYDELLKRRDILSEGGNAEHLASTNAELAEISPEIQSAYRRAAETTGIETVEPEPFPSFAAMLAAHEHGGGNVQARTVPEVPKEPPLGEAAGVPGVPGVPAGGEAPAGVEGQAGAAGPVVPAPQRSLGEQKSFIADDVAQKLIAAGRPEDEARAAGQVVAARYATRAGRFEGKLGTAEELYRKEGAAIAGPNGKVIGDYQAAGRAAPPVEPAKVAEAAATPPTKPGVVANDFDTADRVKNEWRQASPYKETEPFIQASWHNQRALGEAADGIAKDLGIEFKNPGIKAKSAEDIASIKDEAKRAKAEAGRRRLETKAQRHGIGGVTDQVRGGFEAETPEQADQIIAKLGEKFQITDEGWQTNPDGYFDRKAYVRFPDGMIGEVQIWPPGMFHAKEHAGGHILYEGVRELPPWHPLIPEFRQASTELFGRTRAALSPEWKAVLGNSGNEPNLLPNAVGESTTPLRPTSAALTSDHFPPESTQASEGEQKNGSPSNEPAFNLFSMLGSPTGNVGQESAFGNHAEPVRAALESADKINELTPSQQKKELPKYSVDNVSHPQGVDQPAGVFMFDPTALNVDAKRFQFKSGGDEYGVTGALRSVTKWDPAKAQSIIVWEQADGKLFVADGHQRAGLARRLTEKGGAKGIELPGVLYREKDGISADDIRAIAAVTNIANGSGSAIDGAKVLRARPDLMDGSLPLSAGKGKQAAALAKLGDEPFKMVLNEVIPEHYGAVVGDLIPNDPARQEAAIKAISRFEPKNETEAAVLTQRVAQAELAKREEGAQASMFGDLETAESTAGEEMKIVGRAIADLKKDRSLFGRVLANAERIEQTGSHIQREAASGVATDAEIFAKTLASDAYTAGPIRDALVKAARDLKDGTATVGEASARIVSALRAQAEENGANRAGSVEPGAEAKEYAQRKEAEGNEGLAYLIEGKSKAGVVGKETGTVKPNGISNLKSASAPEGYAAHRLVYAEDGKILGAMQITKSPSSNYEVANTYVAPEARRQGVATKLNQEAARLFGELDRSEGPSPAGEAFRQSLGKEFSQRDEDLFEAGAEGKPQQLIPGVKPVSQRDLVQAAANKPMKPKAAQKPIGGLFGDSMDQKELFQTARGKIRLTENERPLITLMKDANPSTFMHESGHDFLEQMKRDAAHPDAPDLVKSDFETAKQWMGVGEDGDLKTKHHEKFARGFEQYLREGVAPSQGLARVFTQFRNWLLTIYQSIKGLGTEISPEIRGVFDRMLEMEPKRTVIAPEERPMGGPALHEIHEGDATHAEPHEAEALADRAAVERERYIQEPPPEIAHEIAATVQKVEAEQAARAGTEPGAEAGEGAGGQPEVDAGGGGSEPEPAGGGVGAGGGKVGEGRGGAETEGAAQPDRRSKLDDTPGTALAPGPADLFGASQSPFTDRAGNIRLDNLNTTKDVEQAIRDSAAENENFIGDRRGVITDGQVLDLADALGMDAGRLSQRKLGQAFNAEQIIAARKLLIESATQVSAAMKKAAIGTDEDVLAYAMAKDRHQMIQANVAGITAEAGRALRAFRKLPGQEAVAAVEQMLKEATGKTLFQLKAEAVMGAALDSPMKVSKFVQDAQNHSFGRMIMEYFVNNLISGPATHSTYMVGNMLLLIEKQLLVNPTAAALGSVRAAFGNEGPRVYYGEAAAGARGAIRGIAPALQAMGESFKAGVTAKLPNEETQPSLPLQPGAETAQAPTVNLNTTYGDLVGNAYSGLRSMRDGLTAIGDMIKAGGVQGAPLVGAAYSPLGHIPNIQVRGMTVLPLGTAARASSRMVATVHTLFRVLNYSAEINQMAYRAAVDEGRAGPALDARTAELRQAPTEEMMNNSAHTATDLTMMGQSGEFMKRVSRLFNWETNLPLLGTTQPLKFIDPFVQIAGQVVKHSVGTHTPLGLISNEIRSDIMGGNGKIAQDLAMAKMLVGSVIGMTFGGLAAEGMMSGSGPTDPHEAAMWRLAGNQAHSVRIGDIWYNVHKLGPLGALASIAADIHDVAKFASQEDLQHAAASFMHAFTQNFLDEGFLKGPSDLLKAIEDSGRYGGSYVKNFLSSFTPYSVGLSQINQDPYFRQTYTILDGIKAKIPVLSETLHPRRDIWGEPMAKPGAIGGRGVTAIYAQHMSTDPVNQAMVKLGVHPGPVNKKLRNVELTPEQYDDYARIAGRSTKMRLDAIVRSPDFQTWPDNVRYQVIEETIKQSREMATGAMFAKYPDVAHQATVERLAKIRGEKKK